MRSFAVFGSYVSGTASKLTMTKGLGAVGG